MTASPPSCDSEQGYSPSPTVRSTHALRRKDRILHLRRSARVTTSQWRKAVVYWIGAVLIGVISVVFAKIGDWAADSRSEIIGWNPWVMLIVTPVGLAFITWMTRTIFKGAQGSGIPQTIATLHIDNYSMVDRVLSLRISLGKILLTSLGLICGASIGREGPSVQIGASIMHAFSRFLGQSNIAARRSMILAGGAAGMAAAFNTPLAGIVFAIEELSHSFEQKASGRTLTVVVLSGVTAIALLGNYTYFGHADVTIPIGTAWIAVLTCGILGGLAGGGFSAILIWISKGIPGWIGRFGAQRPIAFAAACGLILAIIGIGSNGSTYGTGYAQAHAIFNGTEHYPASFFILKYLAMIVSYCSGIPGGMFAPSLAIGAGIGGWIEQFLPHTAPGAVVLLGTVAYFCGVAQSPLTATIIVMEICDNQQVTLALLATSFLAFGVSKMVCPRPLYTTLADRFMEATERAAKAAANVSQISDPHKK